MYTPLKAWLDEIRPTLQPPVCNKMLFASAAGLQIMVVGGPNQRSDFHIESGEELFLQLEGRMVLRVEEQGRLRDIEICEGEMFLLPPHIPHSPQRFAGTMGLVLERARREGDGLDGLRWYVAGEGNARVLYEETFHCTDLAKQLGPVIARFKASPQAASGVPDPSAPPSPLRIDSATPVGSAEPLEAWAARGPLGSPRNEFLVEVVRGRFERADVRLKAAEVFVYLIRGTCRVSARGEAAAGEAGTAGAGAEGGGEGGAGDGTGSLLWEKALGPQDTLVVTPADAATGRRVLSVALASSDEQALCLLVHY
jgi:3-hydroxyanthranilate 3,4-dioxygenase